MKEKPTEKELEIIEELDIMKEFVKELEIKRILDKNYNQEGIYCESM